MQKFLFSLSLFFLSSSSSFIIPRPSFTSHLTSLAASPGAPSITKQKTIQTTKPKTAGPEQKLAIAEPQSRVDHETEDAPRFKVMLHGDEDYDETHVTERMVDVIDDVDKRASIEIYKAAQATGKAMIGVFVLEMAEFYVEQLQRSEPMIFSDLEKE